jgi:hypothetical protein
MIAYITNPFLSFHRRSRRSTFKKIIAHGDKPSVRTKLLGRSNIGKARCFGDNHGSSDWSNTNDAREQFVRFCYSGVVFTRILKSVFTHIHTKNISDSENLTVVLLFAQKMIISDGKQYSYAMALS